MTDTSNSIYTTQKILKNLSKDLHNAKLYLTVIRNHCFMIPKAHAQKFIYI